MKKILLAILHFTFTVLGYSQQLSLKQCIDTAIKNNYSIRLAGYDVLQAQEKIAESKSNLLPKISAAIDYRYFINLPYQLLPAGMFGGQAGTYKEAQFGLPHNLGANVQLAYPLYNPVLQANIKTIQKGEAIAGLQQLKSQEDIAMEISNVYYNAQVLMNQLSFVDSNIFNSKKLLAMMQLLLQQKMAKGTDVEKINLQLAQLQTQKETIESQYSQVINMLKFLMGKSQSDTVTIDSNPGNSENVVALDLPLTETKLAEQQISFLQAEKAALEKLKLPVINLNGFYGTTAFAKTGSNDFLKFYPLSYVGVQLIVPLYTGNVTNRKIQGKALEIEKAGVKLAMVKEKNEVEKLNNTFQLNMAQKNLQTIELQIKLAQNIYTKTLLQQKEGVAALTDVLLADNTLREAQQNYINALVGLRRAELENKKLTGNLLIK
jgi:OMF family outer membrane factor